jgi:hypothetical protein
MSEREVAESPYRSPGALVPVPLLLADQVRQRERDAALGVVGKILVKIRKRIRRGKRIGLIRLWNDGALIFKGPLSSASASAREAACRLLDDELYNDGLQVIFYARYQGGDTWKGRFGHDVKRKGAVDTSSWKDCPTFGADLGRSVQVSVRVSW